MRNKLLLLIILLGLIPLLDLFHPGLPVTHDGQDHVARIANFYQNLSEGNIIPRWAGNLNWGFGHPILEFLYPLPSYIASLFHFLGFSLVDSVKVVFGLTFILSGVFMYLWLREFLGEIPGAFGGLLYMLAPYRFVDLYVRGAIGEHMAFVFLPLILFFILKLSKEKFSPFLIVGGALSIAGLILSHNAISLMFFPIIFLYAMYLIWQSKNKKLVAISYVLIAILAFGVASFFWIPAFFEGKYTLRDIVTRGEYSGRFVEFGRFIYGEWNYGITGQFSTQVGILHWIFVVLSLPVILLLYKKRNSLWILALGSFIFFVFTLFLMTSSSLFIWEKLSILQKFQFPWRFLSITVFITSLLGGIVLAFTKKVNLISFILLSLILISINKNYWNANGYLIKPENFYKGIYNSTTDTGESSPVWSIRFMEKRAKNNMEVISGRVSIKTIQRTNTSHTYEVKALERSRILENTLYFPGWNVFVDDKKFPVEFQDPRYRGLMTFYVDKGEHQINIIFKETKLRAFADTVSVVSLGNIIGLLAMGILSKKTRKII